MSAHGANKRYVATQIPKPPIAQFFLRIRAWPGSG
jgi:hypothetical protein